MDGLRRHLSYANVVATLALIIAIAGGTTAIAVSKGNKKTDVNKRGNIRAGRVTDAKLAPGSVTASKLAGIDVVQESFASGTGRVACPPGELLIGGGAMHGAELGASYPEGNGWIVAGAKTLTAGTAYALCLRATPGR